MSAPTAQVYVYRWGWPYFGGQRKGARCHVLARTRTRNTALVRWLEGGTDLVSRNALRRAPAPVAT